MAEKLVVTIRDGEVSYSSSCDLDIVILDEEIDDYNDEELVSLCVGEDQEISCAVCAAGATLDPDFVDMVFDQLELEEEGFDVV